MADAPKPAAPGALRAVTCAVAVSESQAASYLALLPAALRQIIDLYLLHDWRFNDVQMKLIRTKVHRVERMVLSNGRELFMLVTFDAPDSTTLVWADGTSAGATNTAASSLPCELPGRIEAVLHQLDENDERLVMTRLLKPTVATLVVSVTTGKVVGRADGAARPRDMLRTKSPWLHIDQAFRKVPSLSEALPVPPDAAAAATMGLCGPEGDERCVAVRFTFTSKDVHVWHARTQRPVYALTLLRAGLHTQCCEVFGDLGVVFYGTAEGFAVLSLRTGSVRQFAGVKLSAQPAIVEYNQRIYFRRDSDPKVYAFGYYDTTADQVVQTCVPERLPGLRTLVVVQDHDPECAWIGYDPTTGRLHARLTRGECCVHSDHIFYVKDDYDGRRLTYAVHAVHLDDPKGAERTLLTVELPVRKKDYTVRLVKPRGIDGRGPVLHIDGSVYAMPGV